MREGRELGQPLRCPALACGRAQVDEPAAADGSLGGGVAHDVAVAGRDRHRPLQDELDHRFAAGRDRVVAQQHDPRPDLDGSTVETDRKPLADRLGLAWEDAQRGIDAGRRRVQDGVEQDIATLNRLARDRLAGEIERTALAGTTPPGRAVLGVDRTHAGGEAGRADGELIADRDTAREDRSGHDGAGPVQRERAIDREAKAPVGPARRESLGGQGQMRVEVGDALAGHDRDRQDLRRCQRAAGERGADLGGDRLAPLGRGEIGLGQGDDAAVDPEQVDDRQMLARLRHDPVVGRDHEQHVVDARGTGEHGVHEALVAGDVDEAEHVAREHRACRRSRGRSRCRAPSPP